jgi:hypothetical protein
MDIYKMLLIIIGIIVLLSVVIYAAIQLISDIDYKRQISGKRPMREYKRKEPLNEAYNEGLEIEKASKEILTKNEISHTL